MGRSAWFRVAALLLPLGLVAAACGGDDGDEDAAPSAPSAPAEAGCEETVPGSQINYGVFAPTARLDPPFVSGSLVGGTEIAAIYDVLFKFNWETDEYEPKLAESLEPNEDFTEWTLRLREGITYSDGTVLDAQLVSDTMDRFIQPGVVNNAGGYLALISDKTVVDELTLQITLESPWAEFPHTFANVPGMIPNLDAIGDDPEAFAAQPPEAAGVGPYVVERNVPGEELVLTARDDYWDGPVCVETLRFVFIPGTQATYESFRAGQLDVAFLREATTIETAKSEVENDFFVHQDSGGIVLLNHREGNAGSDPRVREAIMLALEKDVINQRAFGGAMTMSKSLLTDANRFYSDAIEEYPTDPDRARQLLDEAKADGYDGSLDLLCSNAPPSPETQLTVEALLEAVGFDVSLQTLSTSEQIGQVFQDQFEATCWGWGADSSTAQITFLSNLHSESVSNRTGYGSPEMDAALNDMLAAAEADELEEAFAEINRIFNEDSVTPVYGSPEQGIVWDPEIKGIVPTAATVFLFDKVYLEE